MAETVSVNISGPALAFLLYENEKSKHEQEGFLLGDVHEIVTKTITDSDSHNVKKHKYININAVISCPRTCFFYNNVGRVDKEALEKILGPKKNASIVGWYLYEPSNNFRLTSRAKIIHKQLCQMFSISSELFSCCLLSSTKSNLESTFSYTHKFLRFHKEHFAIVPMHISNLGESFNSYKPKDHASNSFLKLCHTIRDPKKNTTDWQSIDCIQDKLHSEIIKTMKKLSISEANKEQLERDVQQLRQRIRFDNSMLEEKVDTEITVNAQNLNENNDNSSDKFIVMDADKLMNNVEETSSNLKDDLSILKTNNSEPKEMEMKTAKYLNKAVNENVSKNKVISELKLQKTDEQTILTDTNNVVPSTSETNLIDLTITDDEELSSPTPKLSYCQVTTASKYKKNT